MRGGLLIENWGWRSGAVALANVVCAFSAARGGGGCSTSPSSCTDFFFSFVDTQHETSGRCVPSFSCILFYNIEKADFSVDIVIAALIPTLILFHLIWAPYTKVEESFNIQATHDILTYGVRDLFFPNGSSELQLKDHYDHLTFTGPVPRTSVGALTLATASWPVTRLLRGVNPQIIGTSL